MEQVVISKRDKILSSAFKLSQYVNQFARADGELDDEDSLSDYPNMTIPEKILDSTLRLYAISLATELDAKDWTTPIVEVNGQGISFDQIHFEGISYDDTKPSTLDYEGLLVFIEKVEKLTKKPRASLRARAEAFYLDSQGS